MKRWRLSGHSMVLATLISAWVTGQGLVGCGGNSEMPAGSGGMTTPAGSGGSVAGASGGATGSGGAASVGSGGANASGGTTPVGSGGVGASGGVSGSGGSLGSGGVPGSGGRLGTGGSFGTGGVLGTGGSTSAGGGRAGANGGLGGMGTAAGGTSSGASFATVAALLQSSCSTCHNGMRHVDLRTAGLYPRLTGTLTPGSATMMGCASMALVVPGNPATSLLSKALHGAVSGCTTGVMPKGCAGANCLTAAQIEMIEGWIAAGAPM